MPKQTNMDQQKIKEKLIEFLKSYNTEAGHLNSFRVIYDYASFLKTESYIKEKMGNVVAYGDNQVESATAKVRQIIAEREGFIALASPQNGRGSLVQTSR